MRTSKWESFETGEIEKRSQYLSLNERRMDQKEVNGPDTIFVNGESKVFQLLNTGTYQDLPFSWRSNTLDRSCSRKTFISSGTTDSHKPTTTILLFSRKHGPETSLHDGRHTTPSETQGSLGTSVVKYTPINYKSGTGSSSPVPGTEHMGCEECPYLSPIHELLFIDLLTHSLRSSEWCKPLVFRLLVSVGILIGTVVSLYIVQVLQLSPLWRILSTVLDSEPLTPPKDLYPWVSFLPEHQFLFSLEIETDSVFSHVSTVFC